MADKANKGIRNLVNKALEIKPHLCIEEGYTKDSGPVEDRQRLGGLSAKSCRAACGVSVSPTPDADLLRLLTTVRTQSLSGLLGASSGPNCSGRGASPSASRILYVTKPDNSLGGEGSSSPSVANS